MATPNRFPNLSTEEKEQILEDGDSANTKRSTLTGVKVFRDYLHERDVQTNFTEMPKEELDGHLRNFYFEARNVHGEKYKKSSLITYRHAIQRYLDSKRTVDRVNIIKDDEFTESKKAFKSVMKDLKRAGKAATDHHPAISEADLQKAYDYLTDGHLEDARLLQYKVFLDIMLHFGRRGRENLATLTRKDFAVTRDGNGDLYVYKCCDELTKNHQDDSERSSDGRMYEIKETDRCPVRTFIKYIRRLNPKCTVLFQHPRSEPVDGIYFDNVALGHNRLGKFMSEISIAAKLSTKYTNHSIRATTVHVLDAAQIPSRHIMTVTGHKSESSLKTYSGKTDGATKKLLSQKLSEKTKGQIESPVIVETASDQNSLSVLSESQSEAVIDDLSNFMDDKDNFDDILMSIDEGAATSNYCVSNSSQINVNTRPVCQFPMPVFYNCQNITVNYK